MFQTLLIKTISLCSSVAGQLEKYVHIKGESGTIDPNMFTIQNKVNKCSALANCKIRIFLRESAHKITTSKPVRL